MTNVSSFPRAACVALGLATALGCGGATTPTAPAPPSPTPPVATTTIAYSGIFGSGTLTGTLTMSAIVPVSATALTNITPLIVDTATGTAKFTGASQTAVNLSGTFDTTANRFVLSGGSFRVDATVAGGVATGTIATAGGGGSVAALQTTTANPATQFCGTYRGSETGKFLVVVQGAKASGVAAQDGDPDAITLTGSADGNAVTLNWAWTEDGGGRGTATGTITGATVGGTWSNTVGKSGTWSGGTAGC